MTGELRSRFVRFVRAKKLIAPGERVLVATSGGIDSMVLLHLFKECAAELQLEVLAAHFDHAMRDSSATDAEWLAGVCEAWRIPLIHERSPNALYGEAAARTARYEFLDHAMRKTSAVKLATAHHADDQIETVLFRLMRGTGLRGLAGIPLRRGAIIRPLLRFRKSELQAYAQQNQLGFREDESNSSDVYTRNRIRRALIPVMQSIRPAAPMSLLALARYAARTERAWQSLLRSAERAVFLSGSGATIELARGKLLEYDAEIRAGILRSALRRLGSVPNRAATRAMVRFVTDGSSGGGYDVAGGIRLELAYDVIRIRRTQPPNADHTVQIDGCNEGGAEARIGGRKWCVRWTTSPGPNAGARFDCLALQFPLTVRAWQPGDRMRMPYGSKKLKKLFAERRIPFNERTALPVLVDGNNHVLWVPGVARSSEAPPVGETDALTVTVSNAEIS
jgi:tRNA(Ile)-lysidine synthase